MKPLTQWKVQKESDKVKTWERVLEVIREGAILNRTHHYDARTLDEASYLLEAHEREKAKVIAGGIDILRIMRQKYIPDLPCALVNIKTIPDLAYVSEESGTLEIGALTRLSDIATSVLIKTNYPVLAEAASMVGAPQIRNMVTIAGDICQDLGCWYYRAQNNYYHCLRKGGNICPAKEGDNRWMFSIFGSPKECECYATCQSDLAIVLAALRASVRTTQRTIPIEQFYMSISPGNILRPGEIITEIQLPTPSTDVKAKYAKFAMRKSLDHPLVSVACVAGDKEARVVIGGVFIMPYVASEVGDLIGGKEINKDLAEQAGAIAVKNVAPMSMNAWKVEVTKTLVKRTILMLA